MTEQFRVGFILQQQLKGISREIGGREEGNLRGVNEVGEVGKRGEEERRKAGPAERCLLGRQPLLSSSHPTSPSLSPASRSRAVCRLSRSQVSTK